MYLSTKFQISSIILTSFRKGGVILPCLPPPQKEPLKSPPWLGLTGSWSHLSVIESVFSNVPGCKLYNWIRAFSTTHVFPKNFWIAIFFGTFQNCCFNYLTRSVFSCFCKTSRPSCSILFSLLRRCLPFLAPSLTFK